MILMRKRMKMYGISAKSWKSWVEEYRLDSSVLATCVWLRNHPVKITV